jgi:hypothetical protein
VNRPNRRSCGPLTLTVLAGALGSLAGCNAIIGLQDVPAEGGVDAAKRADAGKARKDAAKQPTADSSAGDALRSHDSTAPRSDAKASGHDAKAPEKDAAADHTLTDARRDVEDAGHAPDAATECDATCWDIKTLVDGGYKPDVWQPCAVAVDETNVYWVDPGQFAVMRVALAGGTPVTVATSEQSVCAIAVDDTYIYYPVDSYSSSGNTVMQVVKTAVSGTPTPLGSVPDYVTALASDGKTLYWTELSPGLVMQAATSDVGGATSFAIGQDNPRGIATYGTRVYWTAGEDGGVVVTSGSAGPAKTIVTGQNTPWGIAVSDAGVYWVDDMGGQVMRLAPGSSTPTVLAADDDAPTSIALAGSNVYWGDGWFDGGVKAVPLAGGHVVTLAAGQDFAEVAAYGETVVWAVSGNGTGRPSYIVKATQK